MSPPSLRRDALEALGWLVRRGNARVAPATGGGQPCVALEARTAHLAAPLGQRALGKVARAFLRRSGIARPRCRSGIAHWGRSGSTRDLARAAGCHVIHSQPNRGLQQRLGAQHASGDIILFIHADTWLPHDAGKTIRQTLAKPERPLTSDPPPDPFLAV